jgi:cytidine deaminase
MRKVSKQQLVAAAMKARLQAVAPYSGFQVGAALLAGSGKTYLGANVESASYGLTCCAERVALFKALTEGEREFEAMAVVAPMSDATPCGACRQLLAEYAPAALVLTADSRKPDRICEFEISKLLPAAFTLLPHGKKNMAKKVISRGRA